MLARNNKLCSAFQGLKTLSVFSVLVLACLNKISLFNHIIGFLMKLIITQFLSFNLDLYNREGYFFYRW